MNSPEVTLPDYSFNGPDLAMGCKNIFTYKTVLKLHVKYLTVTLEKTIPVAVKNIRGWISRILAGDRMAQAKNRKISRKNDKRGTRPSRNGSLRSVLEIWALSGSRKILKLFFKMHSDWLLKLGQFPNPLLPHCYCPCPKGRPEYRNLFYTLHEPHLKRAFCWRGGVGVHVACPSLKMSCCILLYVELLLWRHVAWHNLWFQNLSSAHYIPPSPTTWFKAISK